MAYREGPEPFEAREEGRQEIRDAVLELWDEQDGWIPGAAYAQLAEALGVDPNRTLTYRSGGLSRPSWRPKEDVPAKPDLVGQQRDRIWEIASEHGWARSSLKGKDRFLRGKHEIRVEWLNDRIQSLTGNGRPAVGTQPSEWLNILGTWLQEAPADQKPGRAIPQAAIENGWRLVLAEADHDVYFKGEDRVDVWWNAGLKLAYNQHPYVPASEREDLFDVVHEWFRGNVPGVRG